MNDVRECIVCGTEFRRPPSVKARCCSHSCAGQSRSNRLEDLWNHVAKGSPDVCWLWQRWRDRDGYGAFSVGGRKYKAHRLAFQLSTGIDPGELVVCHVCDTPSCCNPAHLFLGTQTENMEDMRREGRRADGERSGNAKLTEPQVVEIRERRSTGERGCDLAAEFGVREAVISEIFHRKLWRHVA